MTNIHQFSFQLAGFIFDVYGPRKMHIGLNKRYQNCIVNKARHTDFVLYIKHKPGIRESTADPTLSVPFLHHVGASCYAQTGFNWKVIKEESRTRFEVPSESKTSIIEVLIPHSVQKNTIYLHMDAGDSSQLLPYPLDILLLYHLSQWHPLLIIHGAGLHMNHVGYLMVGQSGAGKSTLSGLARQAGAHVIQDDRIVLRKIKNKWFMFPLHLTGQELPEGRALSRIYRLFHGLSNQSIPYNEIDGMKHLLTHLVQFPSWKSPYIHQIGLLHDLVSKYPFSALFFTPDYRALNFLSHVIRNRPIDPVSTQESLHHSLKSEWF